jgi:hypothetical protein
MFVRTLERYYNLTYFLCLENSCAHYNFLDCVWRETKHYQLYLKLLTMVQKSFLHWEVGMAILKPSNLHRFEGIIKLSFPNCTIFKITC